MAGEGLVLQAARGDQPAGSCTVGDEPVSVGSWRGATLPLDDADILPVHVVLDPDGEDRWRLVALHRDGCIVNGHRVRRCSVGRGDRINVGPYELVVGGYEHHEDVARLSSPLGTKVRGPERPLRAVLRWRGTQLDARVIVPGSPLILGEGRGVTFDLPLEDGHRWVPVACIEGYWHVALDTPLRAMELTGGEHALLSASPRDDGPAPPKRCRTGKLWTPIAPGSRLRLHAGELSVDLERIDTFVMEPVERPPVWRRSETRLILVALLLLIVLGTGLRLAPVRVLTADEQTQRQHDLIAQYRPPPVAVPPPPKKKHSDEKNDDAGAAKAKEDEGKAGRQDAPERQARRAGPRSDTDIVKQSALLKMLASGATSQMLSGGSLSAASALGHLDGPAAGDAQGNLGLGLRGAGTGGGGSSTDTVGVGPVGAKGVGLGQASGVGKVAHKGGGSDLGMDEPASVEGGLDREVIRRVILSHRAQVRYCYEKQLSVTPDLAGKVLVEFVIAADGSVTTARTAEQTLADPAVGQCIASKIKTWTFPKPKGNGVVVVTYPFLFKPAGQGDH